MKAPTAPIPPEEAARLDALRRCQVVDTPAEAPFDDLTELAAHATGAPIALLSLVDQDRLWFKSRRGLETCATQRDASFCAQTILGRQLLVVPDAARDKRFADHPLVSGAPHVRFYAGAPVLSPDGFAVGTLCVLDTMPRDLDLAQRQAVERLAGQAGALLQLRQPTRSAEPVPTRLQRAHQALRDLIDGLPVAVFECDENGWRTSVNARWSMLTGLTATDAMGMGWLRAVLPEDRERVARQWQEAVRAGRDFTMEHRYRRSDGTLAWAGIQAVAQYDTDGRLTGFTGVGLDITEDRARANELRASHAKLQSLFQMNPVGLALCDMDGTLIDVNDAYLAIIGYAADEARRLRYWDITPPEYAEDEQAQLRCMAATGRYGPYEKEYIRKDGTRVPVLLHGVVVQDSNGQERIWSVVQDVSEAHRAKQVLEHERFFLGQSIANAPIAMAMLDSEMRYLAWSRTWLMEYQLEGQDLTGRSHYDVFPDIPERWKELHRRALAGESLANPEDIFERATGEVTFLRWAIQPWRTANGTIGGIIMVTDVVNDLVRARQEALESSRLKSEFLASMSHEIRTPMNGVLGMTGLLLQTSLNEEQRECAETIRASAEALLTIINDILDFSKIEAGKLAVEPIAFDLHQAIEEVLDLLMPKVQEKRLELVLRCAPEVPRHLLGDAGRLRQLLTNLVSNAVKFTEAGHILVQVTLESLSGDSAVLRFEVTDTGVGIPREKLDLIFDKFTQGDASTTRRFGGTGLGLAICRQLVHLMGGSIGVTSDPGRGSTFWFTLTLPRVPEAPPIQLPRLTGRILIVDALTPARAALQEQLEQLGATVETAADPATARQLLDGSRGSASAFDAVFLSATMPGEDAWVREMPARLILVGAVSSRPREQWLRDIGAVAFVRKPARIEDVAAALTIALQRDDSAAHREGVGLPSTSPPTDPAATGPSGVRVLVVDDNSVNQKVAARMLAKFGCAVEVAANGLEAVSMVAKVPFDVVFMDCMMPEMDGYEATDAIRRMEGPAARTPIVAMTANAMQGDRERCLAAGMDDYLSKPVRPELLRQALERWSRPAPGPWAEDSVPVDVAVLQGFQQLQEAGAPDVVTEFIDLFLGDLPARRDAIIRALAGNDAEKVRDAAHALKGSAAYIGARELARLCDQLEAGARGGDVATAVRLGATVEEEAERVRRYLRARRQATQR